MTFVSFPPPDQVTIQFSHVAYDFTRHFGARNTGLNFYQTRTYENTLERIPEADVLLVSGFWKDQLLEHAAKLKYVQAIGVGYEQFPLDKLEARGILLTTARGVNKSAVSEQAMAMILSFSRRVHLARDNQRKRYWRGMVSDHQEREFVLEGKKLLIFGLGEIGSRLAGVAKAFDMHVIGIKRDPSTHNGVADEVHSGDRLLELIPQADFIVLTCPLTPHTRHVIDSNALAAMNPTAYLINVARGQCVDETALTEALEKKTIAGAGLDVFSTEPLPDDSPFWDAENVLLTPHTAGETGDYERVVIDILMENLNRLWMGRYDLVNRVRSDSSGGMAKIAT